MKFSFIILFIFLFSVYSFAQKTNADPQENYQLNIKKASSEITVDGILSERSWQEAEVADNFWLKFPQDNVKAKRKTEVRMTYDDKFLYISAICMDTTYNIIQTLKRDSRFFESDGFGIILDPVNRRANGFIFGISPKNVQSEDLISPATFGGLNFSWDNKWFSEVSREEHRWIVEMAIPFKTLRFEPGTETWGINFFRNDLKSNEIHTWTNIPINFESYDLGYTGALNWDAAPPKPGTNISIIPYISGSVNRDNEAQNHSTKTNLDGGFDAKVALTSSLNLDLTINPDFSQIDVDVQQTNLTRFNLQFPEKRAFFLENNDLFTNFGTPPARPIFTRSMGLDRNGLPSPILYGVRLSGNLGEKSRIGILNLHTRPNEDNIAQNYSIVTFNQSIFKRSILKGYISNRQAFIQEEGADKENYGRNAGVEFNFKNLSGSWNPWVALHISNEHQKNTGTFRNAGVQYNGRKWNYFLDYIGIDTNYAADIGFIERIENYDAARDTIVRRGYEHFFNRLKYTIRPKRHAINAHDIELGYRIILNTDWSLNDGNASIDYTIQFRNTSTFRTSIENNHIHLLYATKFTDNEPLPPDNYNFTQLTMGYNSDPRKSIAMETEIQLGGFYNGRLNKYLAGIIYREQPWGNFSIAFEQNDIRLPKPYGSTNLFLINQRSEINFSTKLFWTTFLQYNTQQNNFNLNSRLQWRYLPMSDLFISYTDNYFSNPFMKNKNRGIVFKLTYWFTP